MTGAGALGFWGVRSKLLVPKAVAEKPIIHYYGWDMNAFTGAT